MMQHVNLNRWKSQHPLICTNADPFHGGFEMIID